MQKIAVVQRLQTQIVELQVAFGLQGGAQAVQVELQQALVQKLVFNAFADALWKIVDIGLRPFRRCHFAAQNLAGNGVQQQAGGQSCSPGLFDQCACGQDGGLVHLVQRHAVVEIAQGFLHDRFGLDVVAQKADAGRLNGLRSWCRSSTTRRSPSTTCNTGARCLGSAWRSLLRATRRGTAHRRGPPRGVRRASGTTRPGPAHPQCGRCRRRA